MEWEAYDKIDPIGAWREDFRMAKSISEMVNVAICVNSTKGKKVKLTTPLEYMPKWDVSAPEEKKEQTVEEMKEILLGMFSASKNNPKIIPKKE